MLVKLYKVGETEFRLLGTNGFHIKAKKERFSAAGLRCRLNLKFYVIVWQTSSKNCTKKRAAWAARLFFVNRPIKSMISDVDVAVVHFLNSLTLNFRVVTAKHTLLG